MVYSIHVSRHTVYWVQAQVEFGRVYFPGPNRVGARAHFILRLSRRACARANDGLASVNAGQPLMKNLSHFVKSVLYILDAFCRTVYGLTLSHRLNVETALLPVKAEPGIRLKAAQCCLCYCQNLLNQLTGFCYKKAYLVSFCAV